MSENLSLAARLSPYRALLIGIAVLAEITALSQLQLGVHGGWLEGILIVVEVSVTVLLLLARSWFFALLAFSAAVVSYSRSDVGHRSRD